MPATRSRNMKDIAPPINDFRKRKYVEEGKSEADISNLPGKDTPDTDYDDGDHDIGGACVDAYNADEDCCDSDSEDDDPTEGVVNDLEDTRFKN